MQIDDVEVPRLQSSEASRHAMSDPSRGIIKGITGYPSRFGQDVVILPAKVGQGWVIENLGGVKGCAEDFFGGAIVGACVEGANARGEGRGDEGVGVEGVGVDVELVVQGCGAED